MIGRDSAECVESVLAFVEDGLRHGEAVSIGLSAALGRRLGRVLGTQRLVAYFDMTELGRNPGRIIGAMLDFARMHAGGGPSVREPGRAGAAVRQRAVLGGPVRRRAGRGGPARGAGGARPGRRPGHGAVRL